MKKVVILLIFYYAPLIFLFSEEKMISWNVKNNFNNEIYKKENIEFYYEEKMPVYCSIKIPEQYSSDDIDIYLSFDENDTSITENYKILYKKYLTSNNKYVNKQSAYFLGENNRIELLGGQGSFFQSGTDLGSFTVSFWVYPTSFSNNEIILKIGSQYYDRSSDDVLDQSINAKIEDGRMLWEFNNIFSLGNKRKSFILESFNRLFPEKWSKVELSFDSNTGIIREYINGLEEGVTIATEDGNLDSSVLNLRYHSENRCVIILAPHFYGAIDEFYIIKKDLIADFKKYNDESRIESKVINFGNNGVSIKRIIPDGTEEKKSKIIYYYRFSTNPFDDNDRFSSDIKWIKLDVDRIPNKILKFFQWKAVLLTGDNFMYSPKFRGLTVYYENNQPPGIPAGLKIYAEDGKITLKWQMNSEKDLKGYKVYYGTKSKKYFGKDAKEGASPIDVGMKNRFELTGLNKNIIYYFSITAYDDDEHKNESDFSEEIYDRPLE